MGGVLIVSALLLFLIRIGFRRWSTRLQERGQDPSVLRTSRRILNGFITVFGIGLIAYVFVPEAQREVLTENNLRIIWIGLVALGSVLLAAGLDKLFRQRINVAKERNGQRGITSYKYLNYLSRFGIYLGGVVLIALAFPTLRDLAKGALTGAGVLALVIGVASQEAFSNVIGGLFIAFSEPFRIGDTIKVDGLVGTVEDLTLRHTVINTVENKRIVIPNAVMNKENIENYNLTEYKICEFIEVGISYDSDLDLAIEIMREEATQHPAVIDNRSPLEKKTEKPIVEVQVIGLGDSSVNLRAWVWAATYRSAFRMRNDLYRNIKQRFDREGIEIPYPHRTITYKNSPVISTREAGGLPAVGSPG